MFSCIALCYQAEIVFLRCCALKFSTALNTESPKESFSRDHGSSKSRQGCASGLAGRLGFPSSLQHELIKLRSVGMNGAWEPDAVLCREVVITWNSVWGMIYFEVFGSRKFTDDF